MGTTYATATIISMRVMRILYRPATGTGRRKRVGRRQRNEGRPAQKSRPCIARLLAPLGDPVLHMEPKVFEGSLVGRIPKATNFLIFDTAIPRPPPDLNVLSHRELPGFFVA